MAAPGPGARLPKHGPYPPTTAGLGLVPTTDIDVPISAVFLVLFILGAASHMTILQVNLRRGHKFILSGLAFGFCMTRIIACTMRIVWSYYERNVSIAIAAQIFVSAGVVLLFIINLIFAQRIIRAAHPHIGWSKPFSLAFKLTYLCIVLLLAAIITCTVQSFFTLNTNTRRIDRDVQLVVLTFFATVATAPLPLVLLSIVIPKKVRVEKFGQGRFRTKIFILLLASFLLSLGASFRAGTAYLPRPLAHPAWYHSKACFYLFNFTIEITVIALYAILRVDKRFHVPNKSHGPGDYSRTAQTQEGGTTDEGLTEKEKSAPQLDRRFSTLTGQILSEEEVFDDQLSDLRQSWDSMTRVGTPIEKFIDIENGLVLPVPSFAKRQSHNSRRWSVHTMAELNSIVSGSRPTSPESPTEIRHSRNRSFVSAEDIITPNTPRFPPDVHINGDHSGSRSRSRSPRAMRLAGNMIRPNAPPPIEQRSRSSSGNESAVHREEIDVS